MTSNKQNDFFINNPVIDGFDGHLTDEVRKAIAKRRRHLGLSLTNLADFLGINWSTIRKWECGPTKYCAAFCIRKVGHFLAGDYDAELQEQYQTNKNAQYDIRLPEVVNQCAEKVTNTYLLCRYNPRLRQQLVNKVVDVTNRILDDLSEKNGFEPPDPPEDIF